jgi:hypothetical protein
MRPSRKIVLVAAIVLPISVAVGWLGYAFFRLAAGPPFDDLKREGNPVIAEIEQYRQAHGHYPRSLAEAGLEPSPTRYGPWEYESDGKEFVLSIGDYGRDGFVYFYSSRSRSWYADT